MFEALLKGLTLGLLLSISVGPVIFSIIKQSLNSGHRGGIAFILGVSASDIALVLISNVFTEIFGYMVKHQNFFAHKWYVASNDKCDTVLLKNKIDQHLRTLNDDYATERDSALKEIFLEQLPEEKFMKFMELKGKLGSQHKFPRVMKGKMLADWNRFLENGKI